MPDQDRLPERVGISEAARIAGVSTDTIRRRIETGELKAEVVFGTGKKRIIRIKRSELAAHIRPLAASVRPDPGRT